MDCTTRWNSTYEMVQRYLEIHPALIAALLSPDLKNKKSLHSILAMTEQDEQDIKDMLVMLKPLERITNLMSTSTHATISLILPLKYAIEKQCSVHSSDSEMIRAMKCAIWNNMKNRYEDESIKVYL